MLDQDIKAGVDRMLDACELAEGERVHTILSAALFPHAMAGERLVFRPCAVGELSQFDVVECKPRGQKPFLAWAGIVSPSGAWLVLCSSEIPDNRPILPLVLWAHEIETLHKAVRVSSSPLPPVSTLKRG